MFYCNSFEYIHTIKLTYLKYNKYYLKVKNYSKEVPTGVGFGVKTPKQVKQVSKYADAVICGSSIVNKINEGNKKGLSAQKLAKFVGKYVKTLSAGVR